VLRAAGDQDEGIGVGRTADPDCLSGASKRVRGSLVAGFTVEGFEEDGVFLFCVEDWRITGHARAGQPRVWNLPLARRRRARRSLACKRRERTGIYIGQSHALRVDHSVASDNVSGFGIENSTGVRVDPNLASGNIGGILSFALPFLDVTVNADNVIEHNVVRDNAARTPASNRTKRYRPWRSPPTETSSDTTASRATIASASSSRTSVWRSASRRRSAPPSTSIPTPGTTE
jgi:hypothetical protein